MKSYNYSLLIIILFITGFLSAQSDSAIVEYESSSKGILIPRMDSTSRTAILTPEEGLLVYQTSDPKGFYYFNGISWLLVGDGIGTDDQTLAEVLTEGNDAGAQLISNVADPLSDQDAATKKYVDDNDDAGSDDQNISGSALTGTVLTIGIEGGLSEDVDLVGLQDGTGTDDQTLAEVLTESNDAGAQLISNMADPVSDQDAATKKYVDDNDDTGSDDQNISGSALTGTVLTIGIEGGLSEDLDLAGLQDGTGTDDQTLAEVLTESNDAGAQLISNVADPLSDQDAATKKYVDDNDDTGSDDQNISGSAITGTVLTIGIEGGLSEDVDLAGLQDGTGTDDQTLAEVLTESNDAGAQLISNVADPLSDQDAATKKYVDDNTGIEILIADLDDDTKIQVEESADEDRIRFDLAGTEHFIMDGPRLEVLGSGSSVFIGEGSGENDDLTNGNVFIGAQAGNLNSTGSDNTAIGTNAFSSNTTGVWNTAVGALSMNNSTTSNANSALGYGTLQENTTGIGNSAFGMSALNKNTIGILNAAFGSFSLEDNTTGEDNASFGSYSLSSNTTGKENSALGSNALRDNTIGSGNSAIGESSLSSNTTGSSNTAVGRLTLDSNTTGTSNTALGFNADVSAGNLNNATAIGANALVSQSNALVLGNNADVGVGTSTPDEKLHVVGSIKIEDGNEGADKVLISDAEGVASWQTITDSDNQNISGSFLSGTVLTIGIEAGMSEDVDLSGLQDGTGTDDQTLVEVLASGNDAGAQLISNVADPLSDQDAATKKYVDDNDDTGSDDQNISGSALTGTVLTIGIEGGLSEDVDLAGLQDGTGTDDQTLAEVLTESNDAGAQLISNIADPVSDQDAATKKYVDDNTGTQILITDTDDDTKIQVEETADDDKIRFDLEGTEHFVMDGPRIEVFGSGNSVFLGEGAGRNDDLSANSNTFVGFQAGRANTTGFSNTAVGRSALDDNTTGDSNSAFGAYSLQNNIIGQYNSAFGTESLGFNTEGLYNSAFGYWALRSNTLADWNSAFGYHSLRLNTTGEFNTSVGSNSLENNSTGTNNSAVGYNALDNNITGSNNTALGNEADALVSNLSNATAIGANAVVDASNKVRIGDASISSNGGQVAWTAFSDARIKKNIEENIPGLEFITRLRPVSYHFDVDKQNQLMGINRAEQGASQYDIEQIQFSGFLAQEVEQAALSIEYDFSGVDKSGQLLGLRYSEFVVPLVKAVQEQQDEIEELKQMVQKLSEELNEIRPKAN